MREGSRRRTKGPAGNSALLQQPTHPQASSALPAAGTADRGLASTSTQDAAALQKPWTKPILGALPNTVLKNVPQAGNNKGTFICIRQFEKEKNCNSTFGFGICSRFVK